jgi:hypothetical protein
VQQAALRGSLVQPCDELSLQPTTAPQERSATYTLHCGASCFQHSGTVPFQHSAPRRSRFQTSRRPRGASYSQHRGAPTPFNRLQWRGAALPPAIGTAAPPGSSSVALPLFCSLLQLRLKVGLRPAGCTAAPRTSSSLLHRPFNCSPTPQSHSATGLHHSGASCFQRRRAVPFELSAAPQRPAGPTLWPCQSRSATGRLHSGASWVVLYLF